MSTDALRGEEPWLDEFLTAALANYPAEQPQRRRNAMRTVLRAFAANYKRQFAAPASETEKLPVKWHERLRELRSNLWIIAEGSKDIVTHEKLRVECRQLEAALGREGSR
jgi:hypothetical protein